MPKVSVIIPVYNAAKYLKLCLNSVLSQTLSDIEIICVNDGSDDNSLPVLNYYKSVDKRVTVLSFNRKGAGFCRNLGLSIAQGEYLYFLDSDDWIEPFALEKLYTKALEYNSDIVVCKNITYHNVKNKYSKCKFYFVQKLFPQKIPFSMKDVKDDALQLFMGWAWDKLFKHDFIKKNNLQYQNTRSSNDLLFVLVSLLIADKIDVIPEYLVYHRVGDVNSLENTRDKDPYCFLEALKAFIGYLKSNNLYDFYLDTFHQYLINFTHWQIISHKDRNLKIDIARKVVELFNELGITNDFRFKKHITNKQFRDILRISGKYSCFYELFKSYFSQIRLKRNNRQ